MNFNTHELVLRDRTISALNSSLSFPQVLEATREPLLELAQADSAALCLMRVTPSLDFQWVVPGPRIPLLDEYAVVSDHDFVRGPIFARPNVVLRDQEMLSREEYEHSPLYQRSRELGMALERVMAVLLPIRPDFLAAFALYRTCRRAFPSRSATILSSLTAHLVNSVRNCSDVQALTTGACLLEELYNHPDSGFLIVEPPSRVVLRLRRAAGLSASEAASLMAGAKAADSAAAATDSTTQEWDDSHNAALPDWKRRCIRAYGDCQDFGWTGSCHDCLRYCEGQQEWPSDKCYRRKGKNSP